MQRSREKNESYKSIDAMAVAPDMQPCKAVHGSILSIVLSAEMVVIE